MSTLKTIGICKNCTYWNIEGNKKSVGLCTSDKLSEDYYIIGHPADDMLIYPYVEGGWFETGPNFGCVHWMEKK